MTGYISNNLDKILKNHYQCVTNQMIKEENLKTINKNIYKKLNHLVIDVNCVNNQATLINLVKNIKLINKDIKIIILYYQNIDFIDLYEFGVFDFIKFRSRDTILEEIEHIKTNPLKLSDYAIACLLRQKCKYIIGIINLENQSYTSTFITKVMKKVQDIFLLETKEVNTSIIEYMPDINGMYYSPRENCKQNIYDIIRKIPDNQTLIIDFGKFSRCDSDLLVKVYQQLNVCIVVDTDNEITKASRYYHDSMNILQTKTKVHFLKIPNKKNKIKYNKLVKAYANELKKI